MKLFLINFFKVCPFLLWVSPLHGSLSPQLGWAALGLLYFGMESCSHFKWNCFSFSQPRDCSICAEICGFHTLQGGKYCLQDTVFIEDFMEGNIPVVQRLLLKNADSARSLFWSQIQGDGCPFPVSESEIWKNSCQKIFLLKPEKWGQGVKELWKTEIFKKHVWFVFIFFLNGKVALLEPFKCLLIEIKQSPTTEDENGIETPSRGSGDTKCLLFWGSWPLEIQK